jgi:hypothetical protein
MVIFFVLIFISMFITNNANKKLDQEKRAGLISLFSRQRMITFGLLIVLIALYYVNTVNSLIDLKTASSLYFAVILVTFIISGYINYRTLKNSDYPASYIKSYLLAFFIRMLAITLVVLMFVAFPFLQVTD